MNSAFARTSSRTDPAGLVTAYTYDEAGRMLTRDSGSRLDTFAYDDAGNMILMGDGAYTTTIAYDAEHRPVQYLVNGPGFTSPTVTPTPSGSTIPTNA